MRATRELLQLWHLNASRLTVLAHDCTLPCGNGVIMIGEPKELLFLENLISISRLSGNRSSILFFPAAELFLLLQFVLHRESNKLKIAAEKEINLSHPDSFSSSNRDTQARV